VEVGWGLFLLDLEVFSVNLHQVKLVFLTNRKKRNVESLIELLYKTCRARIEERMGK